MEVLIEGVEAKFGLPEDDGKGGFPQAVEPEMSLLGVAAEALASFAVGAVSVEDRARRIGVLVDPVMRAEARRDQPVIAAEPVGRDIGGEAYAALKKGEERCF